MQIDEKDRKILLQLDLDARQSNSKIGKKVGLPKGVVSYRIKRLVESGIIKRFLPTVNRVRLGYKNCQLFVKFQLISPEFESGFSESMKKKDNVKSISRTDGIFDYLIKISYRSLDEANQVISEMFYEFSESILDFQIDFVVNSYYLRNNFLYDTTVISIEMREENPFIPESLGKLDSSIINLLRCDARMPTIEIARKLGITPQTVIKRIKQLRKKDILQGFRTIIDKVALGYHQFHVFLVLSHLSKNREKEIIGYLCTHKNVIKVFKGLGRWNLELQAVLRDHLELSGFIRELRAKFPENIKSYESMLILNTATVENVEY